MGIAIICSIINAFTVTFDQFNCILAELNYSFIKHTNTKW